MNEIRAILEHYKEVRERLRNPPNAVPDTGINLRRSREEPSEPSLPAIPIEPNPVIDSPSHIPFRRPDLTFCSTLEFAAREYGLSFHEIRSHSREYRLSRPRQIAIYLAARHSKQTGAAMARYLGIDHTTIKNAIVRVPQLMDKSDILRQRVNSIERKLLAAYPGTTVPA